MPYVLCLTANILFAFSTLTYTRFARTQGILWMNLSKSVVALGCSFIFLTLTANWTQTPSLKVVPFFLSGLIGLGLGDLFLVSAFARIGSARTMVLWGFQPVFVGLGAYLLFNETFEPKRLFAVILLISCLLTFSFEGFKKQGKWEFRGLIFAMSGIFLDAVGWFFTKYGYEINFRVVPMEGHFYRCLGAVVGFLILKQFFRFSFFKKYSKLSSYDKTMVFVSSFFGTFLAIFLGLVAMQVGHLPSLAAVSVTTPLITALIEHVQLRKWPNGIFLFALLQFLVGFYLLVGYEY